MGYSLGDVLLDNVFLAEVIPATIRENRTVLPLYYDVSQNYPNPFNTCTAIEFSIPRTSAVSLKIYNIQGEEVCTLISERLGAGTHKYNFDASGLTSGVYLYRL